MYTYACESKLCVVAAVQLHQLMNGTRLLLSTFVFQKKFCACEEKFTISGYITRRSPTQTSELARSTHHVENGVGITCKKAES